MTTENKEFREGGKGITLKTSMHHFFHLHNGNETQEIVVRKKKGNRHKVHAICEIM